MEDYPNLNKKFDVNERFDYSMFYRQIICMWRL